ncbi:hypothetical protein O9H85_35495 [Paenibacillus filicis]|uniref:Uncharacterized protein n=1 Tax=Paenibacillus gyeongsangnamensis TaxID=3388067 RepID=A0ABT4QL65_9BACL|nr:hypothetical protein [Paenibacillus filicis]MCZ8517552.1 hypothetical protein [Paenibacillus filicis]
MPNIQLPDRFLSPGRFRKLFLAEQRGLERAGAAFLEKPPEIRYNDAVGRLE